MPRQKLRVEPKTNPVKLKKNIKIEPNRAIFLNSGEICTKPILHNPTRADLLKHLQVSNKHKGFRTETKPVKPKEAI